jgi:uncharacterized membrane protein YeaQ/YmgE (transglycosylase-associated protein family)
MSIVNWLLAGVFVWWAASHHLTNTRTEAIACNVAVAVLGAASAGWVMAPMLGAPAGFGMLRLFVSACGVAALLFSVHFAQQTVAQ